MKLKRGVKFGLVRFFIGRLEYRCYNIGIAWGLVARHDDNSRTFHGTFPCPKEAIKHALRMYETYVMTTAKTDDRLLKIDDNRKDGGTRADNAKNFPAWPGP